jgi:hypothetical protein
MYMNSVELERPHMTVWRMRFAYWINRATQTHEEYVMLIAFHGNNGVANAPQCYVYTYIVCLLFSANQWLSMQIKFVFTR